MCPPGSSTSCVCCQCIRNNPGFVAMPLAYRARALQHVLPAKHVRTLHPGVVASPAERGWDCQRGGCVGVHVAVKQRKVGAEHVAVQGPDRWLEERFVRAPCPALVLQRPCRRVVYACYMCVETYRLCAHLPERRCHPGCLGGSMGVPWQAWLVMACRQEPYALAGVVLAAGRLA